MNNKNLNSKKKNSKNKLAKKIAKSPKNSNVVKLNTNFNTQNLIHFKKLTIMAGKAFVTPYPPVLL